MVGASNQRYDAAGLLRGRTARVGSVLSPASGVRSEMVPIDADHVSANEQDLSEEGEECLLAPKSITPARPSRIPARRTGAVCRSSCATGKLVASPQGGRSSRSQRRKTDRRTTWCSGRDRPQPGAAPALTTYAPFRGSGQRQVRCGTYPSERSSSSARCQTVDSGRDPVDSGCEHAHHETYNTDHSDAGPEDRQDDCLGRGHHGTKRRRAANAPRANTMRQVMRASRAPIRALISDLNASRWVFVVGSPIGWLNTSTKASACCTLRLASCSFRMAAWGVERDGVHGVSGSANAQNPSLDAIATYCRPPTM